MLIDTAGQSTATITGLADGHLFEIAWNSGQ
jgi:hypothetical protein